VFLLNMLSASAPSACPP